MAEKQLEAVAGNQAEDLGGFDQLGGGIGQRRILNTELVKPSALAEREQRVTRRL